MKQSFTFFAVLIILFGSKAYPQALTVSSPQLNFGNVYENAPHSLPLVLTNTLNRTVNVNGIRFYTTYGAAAFSSNDQHITIPASASDTIWVTFSPRHNIYHNSEMVIIDDGLRGYVNVDLVGQGKYSKSYYAASENTSEENLKTSLHNLTGVGYVSLGYNIARDSMFMSIDNKKRNGQGATQNTVECIYTGREAVGYTDRTDCQNNYSFNTEHTFPQSYFASAEPMKSDLHHLFPTDDLANNARGDNPFGYVTGGTTWSGGGSQATNTTFEPRDEQKGVAARALMYFVLRYQNYSNFFTSQENLLRSWDHDFPADAVEEKRNDDIALVQHNRNPFIDYPQFIERITSLSSVSVAPVVRTLDIPEDTMIYGYVAQGVPVDFHFVLVNTGNSLINLTNFALSSPELNFQSGGSDATVDPGESHEVTIRLVASSTAALHAFLTFNTDIPSKPSVSVPIYANDSVFDNVNEPAADEISVSPVPATSFLLIHCSGRIPETISVYDVMGKEVIGTEKPVTGEIKKDVTSLLPGIYILGIENGGRMHYTRFIKN